LHSQGVAPRLDGDVDRRGGTKVHEHGAGRVRRPVEEDVVRLDVSVRHAGGVHRRDAAADALKNADELAAVPIRPFVAPQYEDVDERPQRAESVGRASGPGGGVF